MRNSVLLAYLLVLFVRPSIQDGFNIAYNTPITGSSLASEDVGYFSYANDGDTRGDFRFCWVSGVASSNWLRLDFGSQKSIKSGLVIGSTD